MNAPRLLGSAVRLLLVAVPLLLAPMTVSGQDGDRVLHTITTTAGTDRHLAVSLPASYSSAPDARFPVLYVLDGESNLDHAAAVATYLADAGVMPETIVVGLYGGTTRAVDYLPPTDVAGAQSGRADAFLRVLEGELIPFVDEVYRTGEFRMISGHSFGGVFVTWTAATRPNLFDAYLAQSPFVDESTGERVVAEFDARSTSTEVPDYYFANVGAEPNLLANVRRLGEIVVRDDDLQGGVVEEPVADHMLTRLVGLHDGLIDYFADLWSPNPSRLAEGGAPAFDAHLEQIEARMGFLPPLGEAMYQRTIPVLLQSGDIESARAVGQRYVDQYPGAPTAHFLLGNVLAAAGDREGALDSITTAIRVYEADPDPQLAALYPAMQALHGQLSG